MSTRAKAAAARKESRELVVYIARYMHRNKSPCATSKPSDEEEIIDIEDDKEMGGTQHRRESDGVNQNKTRKRKRKFYDKRGRPPTSGDYVELVAKKQMLNEQTREKEDLKLEKKLRDVSAGELYTTLGIDLDMAVDKVKWNPTGDLTNRAREALNEVLIITRSSRNLKGTSKKALKHAAVVASAALEVLRAQADSPTDADMERQLRGINEELAKARQEASQARKELNKLKAEMEKLKSSRKEKKEGRRYVESSDSSPETHTRELRKKKAKDSPKKKSAEESGSKTTEIPMEIDTPEISADVPPPQLWN